MSINLPYVEVNTEKLQPIFRSQKIRSNFYTESALCKLLCQPKYSEATENKSNIVYEIDCSNCEAVCIGKSKRSLKSRSNICQKLRLWKERNCETLLGSRSEL